MPDTPERRASGTASWGTRTVITFSVSPVTPDCAKGSQNKGPCTSVPLYGDLPETLTFVR
jgi:hypothetical protein